MFRISIGEGRVNVTDNQLLEDRVVCDAIIAKLSWLKSLSSQELRSLPEAESEQLNVNGKQAVITTYREQLNASILFVVPGFLPTWRFPTYFSLSRIGRIYAEGLVITSDSIKQAEDDLLWTYR